MKRLTQMLFLMLLPLAIATSNANAAYPGYMLARMGTISGQLFVDGVPLPNAIVSFFPVERGLPPLSPDMTSIPETKGHSDNDGNFSIKIIPGTYYLGMLVRDKSLPPGPPKQGEPFYFAADPGGTLRKLTLGIRGNIDVGRVDGAKPETFKEESETFTVKGAVVDDQGQPFPEVLVFAKEILNQPRPDYISERTGKDGLFTLRLPTGRNYYLFARQSIGFRKPAAGEPMGVYGIKSANGLISPAISGSGGPPPGVVGGSENTSDNNAKTVTGKNTEIVTGLEIVMYAIPDADELKSSLQGKDTSPMFELGANLNNIYFTIDSDRLEERSFNELDKWAKFLNGSPNITVEISGHTDNTGSKAHNRKLSEKRALAVAKYLHEKGVDAQRLKTVGYGPDHPVDDNTTVTGREKNRRVEIRFVQ